MCQAGKCSFKIHQKQSVTQFPLSFFKKGDHMKKTEKIITYCIAAVSLIAVIAMGLHLEMKLSKLSETDPIVIYTPESTSASQVYSTTYAAFITESTTCATYKATELSQSISTETCSDFSQTLTQASDTTLTATHVVTDPTTDISINDKHNFTSSYFTEYTSAHIVETQPAFSDNIIQSSTSKAAVRPEDTELFVTKSGKKFHLAGCSYLSKSCITITYDEALEKGYSPCSRCFKSIDE